jgi:hypothetical protein
MSLLTTATELTDAVKALGIRATMDPRRVNAPCVLLVPPDIEQATGCGALAAWTCHLIAPGPGDLDSTTWLLENLPAVFDAVGGFTAEYGSLSVLPDSDPMPAYTITVVQQPF